MSEIILLSVLVLGAALFRVHNVMSEKLMFAPLFPMMIGFSMTVSGVEVVLISQATLIVPVLAILSLALVRHIPSKIVLSLITVAAFFAGAFLAGDLNQGGAAVMQMIYSLVISAVLIAVGMKLRYWLLSRKMMKRCHQFKDCTECELFEAHGG